MIPEVCAYRAVIEEGDGRRRKNGGSPRANLGIALSPEEVDVVRSDFVKLRQVSPKARVIDEQILTWTNLWEVGAIILHMEATKQEIGRTHMLLERAGLHNETMSPLPVPHALITSLQSVGKKQKV